MRFVVIRSEVSQIEKGLIPAPGARAKVKALKRKEEAKHQGITVRPWVLIETVLHTKYLICYELARHSNCGS
jgi:hypothetical protein